MADLKNIDVDGLIQPIVEYQKRVTERFGELAESVMEEIRQASRALTAMPTSTSDLIATAEVLLVAEIDARDHYGVHDAKLSVDVDWGGRRVAMQNDRFDLRPRIGKKRYRALFVLIPLEDTE